MSFMYKLKFILTLEIYKIFLTFVSFPDLFDPLVLKHGTMFKAWQVDYSALNNLQITQIWQIIKFDLLQQQEMVQ